MVQYFDPVGHSRAEASVIRNKSAASKANRSIAQENSVVHASLLPSLAKKKRGQPAHLVSVSVEDQLVKDRLNKQHHKVEQEIKKYDEILKKNKNLRNQYDPRQKDREHRLANNENHNSSMIERSSDIVSSGKDLIKIHGVKLDNRNLDVRIGARSKAHNSSELIDPLPGNIRLPSIGKNPIQQKQLMPKYKRLR